MEYSHYLQLHPYLSNPIVFMTVDVNTWMGRVCFSRILTVRLVIWT
jgi:hypothetical protein